ncbi:7TM diverse intracellular signaling domain-containing protein [Marinobacteraceae bacterium S3BR75-40.1]
MTDEHWRPLNGTVFVTAPGAPTQWLQTRIKAPDSDKQFWLVLEPLARNIQVYLDGEPVLDQPLTSAMPLQQRAIPHPNLIVPLPLKRSGAHHLTLKLEPDYALRSTVHVVDTTGLATFIGFHNLIMGGFIAVILALAIYNTLLFFSVGDRLYLTYVFGVILAAFYIGDISRLLLYIPPSHWDLGEKLGALGMVGMMLFHALFVQQLLQTKTQAPLIHKALRVLAVILMGFLVGILFFDEITIIQGAPVFGVTVYLLALYVSFRRSLQGHLPSQLFLMGWIPVIGTLFFILFEYHNIVPPSKWTLYLLPAALVWEMLMFSLALAARIKVLRDEREHLQQERLMLADQAREALAQSNRIKDDFLTAVSHELRTPLHTVSGHLDLLGQAPMTPEQRTAFEAIRRANEKMTRQVGGILDFADAQSDTLVSSPQPLRPSSLVALLKDEFAEEARYKSVGLSLHVDHDVPDTVLVDALMLEKVLYQIIDNAVKFTPPGGQVLVECHVSEDGDRHMLQWSVSDSGQGIPEHRRKRVFQAFEQGEGGLTRRYGGVGLGLPLAHTLLQAMKGRLDLVKSDPTGTQIRCIVPFVPYYQGAGDAAEGDQPDTYLPRSRQHRILVVEDDMGNRLVLRKQLEKLGFDTEGACDGQEAIDTACREPFDLILMDCQMPIMDGITATREIRLRSTLNHKTPIVAVTANATHGYQERCLEAGMSGFKVKPLRMADLKALLEDHQMMPGLSTP